MTHYKACTSIAHSQAFDRTAVLLGHIRRLRVQSRMGSMGSISPILIWPERIVLPKPSKDVIFPLFPCPMTAISILQDVEHHI